MNLRRSWMVILAATLVACGGSGAGDEPAGTGDDATTTTAAATATTVPAGSIGEEADSARSGHRATVTIGDRTFDLHSGGVFWICSRSDTLIAGNYAVDPDGSPIQAGNPNLGVRIDYVVLSPDSTDPQPPRITVQDGAAGTRWQTGEYPDIPEAAITDVTLADGVATGAAVFYDHAAYEPGNPPELVDGTFEIACESR